MGQSYLLHDFAAEPLPALGIVGADPVMHREARVMPLKHALREPRRQYALGADALFRQGKLFLDEDKLYLVREQSDRITRYVEDLDLVRERALVVQEELFNRISQEQNARTYVLSIVAAIFLPITFISGVFGMNVAGLPGLEDINSFWIVSGVMLATSVAILIGLR